MRSHTFMVAALFGAFLLPVGAEPLSSVDGLDLQSVQVENVTLRFEWLLEPQAGQIGQAIRRHLKLEAQQAEIAAALGGRADVIVAEVDRIVGLATDGESVGKRSRMFQALVGSGPRLTTMEGDVHLIVLTQATVKDHLRGGGKLANFEYDKATDQVRYRFAFNRFGSQAEPVVVLALPVAEVQVAAAEIESFFEALRQPDTLAVAIHELVEAAILEKLRPRDPYFRWFSDGFANAITGRLLGEHVGREAADEFAAAYDVGRYEDISGQINLLYWLGKAYEIETPLDSEHRLTAARHAFAKAYAEQFIEKHGMDVVRDILNRAALGKTNSSQNLIDAIRDVTTLDVRREFADHQPFVDRGDGITLHEQAYEKAVRENENEAALSSLLRLMELQLQDWYELRFYSDAALLLLELGHEEYADRVFLSQLHFLSQRGQERVFAGMQMAFIEHAWRTNRPRIAYQEAERLLAIDDQHVPALSVQMHRLVAEESTGQAKQTARTILELDEQAKSPYRRMAQEVLGEVESLGEGP